MPEQRIEEKIIQVGNTQNTPASATGAIVEVYPVKITNIEGVNGTITSSSSDYACLVKSMESAKVLGDSGAITTRSAQHLGYAASSLETSQPMKVLENDLLGGIKITSDTAISFDVKIGYQLQITSSINQEQAIATRPQSITTANQAEKVIEITAIIRAKESTPNLIEQPAYQQPTDQSQSWTQFKDDPLFRR